MVNKIFHVIFFALFLIISTCNAQSYAYKEFSLVDSGEINNKTVAIKTKDEVQGIAKINVWNSVIDTEETEDVRINIQIENPGTYLIETYSIPENYELLKIKDTTGSLTLEAYFKINSERITKRIVYDTFNGGNQSIGKFELEGNTTLDVWLPKNLILSKIRVKPFTPPEAPAEAERYKPNIKPIKGHPRLWVNKENLSIIRKRLNTYEHENAWRKVKTVALSKFEFNPNFNEEMFYSEEIENVIEKKAFYYLMTEDESIGDEAVDLLFKYLSVLEFGNVKYGDISREIGRAVYKGALVYDWCYDLIEDEKKLIFRNHFKRLVREMEIGWPPFQGMESIINGHGNEAQILRDMLSWSLAVYDEDSEPYKYVSYTILEQLVPMRKFEYQSSRHNQGVDYGAYRFGWEMHAVWIFYRMLGYSVFDDNLKNMSDYWLYMRTPDGKMLRDGDMFNVQYSDDKDFYWKNPTTMLLMYSFSGNGLIKGEFYKQGGLPENPVLFLLLNDPGLKADYDLSRLPLTKDFGKILGSMVARTGWDEEKESGNVIAEIKGGGYHFGNHQHADAGALQIYHHGIQVGDLGLYLSYGSDYDFNFNKRSVSHSMVLIRDPNEPLLFRTKTNDGGTRFSQRFPLTVEEVTSDPWYHTGTVKATAMGPDKNRPDFSFYNVDLTAAYSAKVKSYARSFLFLNLNHESVPAVIILLDELENNKPDFDTFWQINTIKPPKIDSSVFVLQNELHGNKGTTYVEMIKPSVEERNIKLYQEDSSAFVFGDLYNVSSGWQEANGTRILVSKKNKSKEISFATIFQMTEGEGKRIPVKFIEKENYYYFNILDQSIIMAKPNNYLNEPIKIEKKKGENNKIVLLGLKDGFWSFYDDEGNNSNINILRDNHSFSFTSDAETIFLEPTRKYGIDENMIKNK